MRKQKIRSFKFKPFSKKQRMLLNWWQDDSPVKDKDGIIADGAVRSGKTLPMSLSFVMWAMTRYDGCDFIMAGKTVGAFRRNVLNTLKSMLKGRGYETDERRSENLLIVSKGDVANNFYIFGGQDESSQDVVQGLTAAGAYFDEVALMPESFVNQAVARCSVEGAKLWFNCNPAGPMHWFKTGWIDRHSKLNMLYLHFDMDDNLTLSKRTKERYRLMYVGVFFQRYILGLWAMAEGLIYTMFGEHNLYTDADKPKSFKRKAVKSISVDYGTANPTVFLEVWDDGEVLWFDNEYRWDSKSEEAQRSFNPQKTDEQYADDMADFMGTDPESQCMIIVDPSAASFIAALRGRGWVVKQADNDVLDGIRDTSSMIARRHIRINKDRCKGLIAEMQSYVWDDKASMRGEEKPVKALDHGPDALRYRVMALPEWRRRPIR